MPAEQAQGFGFLMLSTTYKWIKFLRTKLISRQWRSFFLINIKIRKWVNGPKGNNLIKCRQHNNGSHDMTAETIHTHPTGSRSPFPLAIYKEHKWYINSPRSNKLNQDNKNPTEQIVFLHKLKFWESLVKRNKRCVQHKLQHTSSIVFQHQDELCQWSKFSFLFPLWPII